MNDYERAQWIANDEGLYNWFRRWRGEMTIARAARSQREFIRQNRAEIDRVIANVTGGKRPAHYLTYGG